MSLVPIAPHTILDFVIDHSVTDNIGRVRFALGTNHLVLLKRQNISMDQQIEFTSLLGQIELVWEDKHPESDYIQLLQNKRKKYEPFKSTSRHWHTDRSFMIRSSKYTCLYAVAVESGCGGTEFCDMHSAYSDLNTDYKDAVSDLDGIHSFNYKFPELMRKKLYLEGEIQSLKARYPDVVRPIVNTNYVSRKRALFLSELCLEKVVGMPKLQSDRLLDELYAHALSPKYRFVHNWEQGDVLIWDNESFMHRALPTPANVKRTFHRTTTISEIQSHYLK